MEGKTKSIIAEFQEYSDTTGQGIILLREKHIAYLKKGIKYVFIIDKEVTLPLASLHLCVCNYMACVLF